MRQVIGWLDKPTKDGRVLTGIVFRHTVPVIFENTYVGAAWDFQIVEGEITCETDVPIVLPTEALSLNVNCAIVDSFIDHAAVHITGTLTALTLIPRETWAW